MSVYQLPTPQLVETTIIDGADTHIHPVDFDVAYLDRKSSKQGTLGFTNVQWPGGSGRARYAVVYQDLSTDDANVLALMTIDRTDGGARTIKFSRSTAEPELYCQRFDLTLIKQGDLWRAELNFPAGTVPLLEEGL